MSKIITMVVIVLSLGLCGQSFAAQEQHSVAAISQRTAPVGQVSVAAASQVAAANNVEKTVKPSKQVAKVAKPKKTSSEKPAVSLTRVKQIYQQHCQVCHASGLANAPKFGDAKSWSKQVAAAKAKLKPGQTVDDILLANAIKGVNAMPARGTCSQCSDAELLATIKYIRGATDDKK